MFSKILIANRGEIAVRIIRTAHEMDIRCVAVYSELDRDAAHVRMADEAYLIGPAAPSQSYLNAEKLVEIALRAGAEGVHPGYGFLAENAAFARNVVDAGLTWIGPHADAIEAMGDKLRARQAMQAAGVPIVAGTTVPIDDAREARAAAERFGLPLALKASGGGGGKGLRVARTIEDLPTAFETARREAEAYFKNGTIYAEHYLDNPKHIELQILADKHGQVLHVGERDCSLQRRHQKLWEEAPAGLSDTLRGAMRAAAIRAGKAIGYDSVGTIECLVSGDSFYFLEMNTRIQVEHTVTEMISGLDLIREQIRIAAGEPLGFAQDEIDFRGHAIEGRVNAEDPSQGFRPAPGTITAYREPAGLGIRVDSAAYAGLTISPDYDSMIAKLIVWAPTRLQAIARLLRAADEFVIEGVPTTLPLLRALCDHPAVVDGSFGTATLETFAGTFRTESNGAPVPSAGVTLSGREAAPAKGTQTVDVEVNDRLYRVRVIGGAPRAGRDTKQGYRPAQSSLESKHQAATSGDDVISPMHGVVVELAVSEGDEVTLGQVVAVIEAMKMMNEIHAQKSGKITRLHAAAGRTVEAGSPLMTIGS
ncbi:MAG: acetyl-CoA carboxylase biotin carboxylase subunit [Candidatus Eremiobacteraeota bacterium]|nr:acetyl-CoA carboxylase biotin carboxylase subunit [Candidatus Eremiobacteraeota bacterium]